MSNETFNAATGGNAQQTIATADAPDNWRGMTLDELRRARGKALVRREVGRATIQFDIEGVKSNIASNGVRVTNLKTADYVLLGFKLMRWIMGMRNGGRRRRR